MREVRGEEFEGEVDGEEEGVVVGEEVGDEEVERPLVCVGWRRRCCRSVEDSSRASAPRLEAERLANSALAWLEEALSDGSAPPSWGYLRSPGANRVTDEPPEEGRRPEKLAARVPVRRGSVRMLPPRA